ncbi:MAG: arsenic resistance protein [Candidatus Moraniibacteriota bacterium]
MIKLLDNIQKHLFLWITSVIIVGLSIVYFFDGYKFSPIICLVAAIVMIYPSFVPLSFDKLPQSVKNYPAIIASIVINFILFPFLAYYVGEIFLEEEYVLRLGLILLALLPGGGMVTTWAMRSRADMSTTIGIVIINLLIAIVAVPFGLSFFMNHFGLDEVEEVSESMCVIEQTTQGVASCDFGGSGVSPMKIAIPIFVIVVIPLIAAFVTQKIIRKKKGIKNFNKIKKNFGKFSNLGLLVVLLALMSLENNSVIFENPGILMDIFIPLVILYGIGFGVIILLFKSFKAARVGKAFIWGSYLRYITLALGIAISLVFQDERLSIITTVIVLSYFIQIPSSFLISKYLQDK